MKIPVLRRVKRCDVGMVFIWVLLAISAIFGMAAYGVDVSLWYSRKSSLQTTADAAALASAYAMSGISNLTARSAAGTAAAQKYISYYGYDPAILDSPGVVSPNRGHTNWVTVELTYQQPNMFFGALGHGHQNIQVSATAQWTGVVDSPIIPSALGISPGTTLACGGSVPYNFSLYGLYADTTNGDNYGPMYWDNNTSNPSGKADFNNKWHVPPSHPDEFPNWPGYDFTIKLDPNYVSMTGSSQVAVELFDPDSYNVSGITTATPDKAWEEDRSAPNVTGFPHEKGQTIDDTTVYEIHWTADDGTDTILGSATYDGTAWWSDGYLTNLQTNLHAKGGFTTTQATAMTVGGAGWVLPASGYGLTTGSFLVDASSHLTGGRLHLMVYTTDGTGENGFSVRAGPPAAKGWDPKYGIAQTDSCTWNSKYGDATKGGVTVSSHGVIPMNFESDGEAWIDLGEVPTAAAGGTFTVDRFDTDVAANGQSTPIGKYYYTAVGAADVAANRTYVPVVSNAPALPSSSIVAKVGAFGLTNALITDTIYLPTSYTDKEWHIDYSAGANDTSTWRMGYSGGGVISLVGLDQALY